MTDISKEAVTRFHYESGDYGSNHVFRQDPTGELVRYEDYQALAAERDALKAALLAADDLAYKAERVFMSEYVNTRQIEGAREYFDSNMKALTAFRAALKGT